MIKCQKYLTLCLLLVVSSCSRVSTLNLRAHNYSESPSHIVWFQVPGLTTEQLAMLKFSKKDRKDLMALEDFTCHSKMWSYNLYDIRPDPVLGLLSQMTGSKNIKSACGDLPERPFWDYFSQRGYNVGVYEHGASAEESLLVSRDCAQASSRWGENLTLWLTQKAPENAELFHYQDKDELNSEGVYYDRSCQQGKDCFTGLYDNASSIWRRFKNERGLNLFVIRDFSYLKAMRARDISLAREKLADIEKTLARFMHTGPSRKSMLILLTSSASQHVEMPQSGRQWADFERKGKNVLFKRTSLMSFAMAKGPRAENFCGVFDENEVLGRMLFTPEQKKLPAEIIDLF